MNDRTARRALARFGIDPETMEEVHRHLDRVVWRVKSGQGEYALKCLTSSKKAEKITALSDYLYNKGVPVLPVMPTRDGELLTKESSGSFLLFPWIPSTWPRYDESPDMIERMTTLLAQFHQASVGYVASGAPVPDSFVDWPSRYSKKIVGLVKLIKEANRRDDPFSRLFRSHSSWLRSRAAWALERLPATSLASLVQEAHRNPVLWHGDYSRANLLIDQRGKLRIIDLDSVSRALPIGDLSRFVTLVDHDLQNWSNQRFRTMLTAYDRVRPLTGGERELILVDQVFPYQAISVARAYYQGRPSETLFEEFERCVRTERDKLTDLGMGPR